MKLLMVSMTSQGMIDIVGWISAMCGSSDLVVAQKSLKWTMRGRIPGFKASRAVIVPKGYQYIEGGSKLLNSLLRQSSPCITNKYQ